MQNLAKNYLLSKKQDQPIIIQNYQETLSPTETTITKELTGNELEEHLTKLFQQEYGYSKQLAKENAQLYLIQQQINEKGFESLDSGQRFSKAILERSIKNRIPKEKYSTIIKTKTYTQKEPSTQLKEFIKLTNQQNTSTNKNENASKSAQILANYYTNKINEKKRLSNQLKVVSIPKKTLNEMEWDKISGTYRSNQKMAEKAIQIQEQKIENATTNAEKAKERQKLALAYIAGATKYFGGSPIEYLTQQKIAPLSQKTGTTIIQAGAPVTQPIRETINKIPSEYKNNIIYDTARATKNIGKGIIQDPAYLIPIAGTHYFISNLSANNGKQLLELQEKFRAAPKQTIRDFIISAKLLKKANQAPKTITNYLGERITIHRIPKEYRAEYKELASIADSIQGDAPIINPWNPRRAQVVNNSVKASTLENWLSANRKNVNIAGSSILEQSMTKKLARQPHDVEVGYRGKRIEPPELLTSGSKETKVIDYHPNIDLTEQYLPRFMNPINRLTVYHDTITPSGKIIRTLDPWVQARIKGTISGFDSSKAPFYRYSKDIPSAVQFYKNILEQRKIKELTTLPIITEFKTWKHARAYEKLQAWKEYFNKERAFAEGKLPPANRKLSKVPLYRKEWFEKQKLGEKGSIGGGKYEKLTEYDKKLLREISSDYIKNTRFKYPESYSPYSPNYGKTKYLPYNKQNYSSEDYPKNEKYKYNVTDYPEPTPDYPDPTPDYPEPTPYYPIPPIPTEETPYKPNIIIKKPPIKEKNKSKLEEIPKKQVTGWNAIIKRKGIKTRDKYSFPSKQLAVLRGLDLIDKTSYTHTTPVRGTGIPSKRKNRVEQRKFYQKNGTYYEKKKYWLDQPQEKNEYMRMLYQNRFD